MTEAITPAEFSEAEGVEDWRTSGEGAYAHFRTRSFATGMALVNEIGRIAEAANHHPDVDLRYRGVTVRLVTHDVQGLSERDVRLARKISGAARELGAPADVTAVQGVDLHTGMSSATLLPFVRYHQWANERILSTASGLPDEELRVPAPLDHGTLLDTLRHLVDVDWSWREFCTGNDVGQSYVWDHGFVLDDLEKIHAFCREEDVRLREYVGGLDAAALGEPVRLGGGAEDVVPRWLIVAHVVNHGTQHRSEVARYLTDRGRSPGDLDLIDALNLP
jgi:4a-hydroxytetrahydrobiopterin dehydratase